MAREAEAAAGAPRHAAARRACAFAARRFGAVAHAPAAPAVWFHSVWTNRVDEFAPQRTHPEALWVWAAAEAPSNWDHSKNQSAGLLPPDPRLDALFNVSMTFQRNSDVLFSYGGCELAPPRPHASAAAAAARAHAKQVAAWFASKKRAVAWTVSHCWTASRREEYVARLRETTQVDVFGKCADLWGKLMGLGHKHHAALLEHDYKMYLAFENRMCRDYITEKFWVDALLNGAIPVVRGGQSDADYAAVAPPGSYINADWFADAAALGAYLTQVANNETLYASYHAWRVTHRLLVDSKVNWAHSKAAETRATCRLCTLLHERAAGPQPPPRLRLNLTRYWSGADSCRAPTDVPAVNVLWAADADPGNGQR